MLGAVKAITVPIQLQKSIFFADSSPIASLNPAKMIPQIQMIGAKTLRMADCKFAIIVSTPACA